MAVALPAASGERRAVAIVAAAHILLFAGLSLALRSVTPPPPPDEGAPVEIVTAAEARAAARATPTPPPAPAPDPSPAPEPAPPSKLETPALPEAIDVAAKPDEPKPEKPIAEKAKPEKPKPKPKPLDTDALSSLLAKAAPRAKPLDTKALSKSLDAAVPKAKPLDTTALGKSLDAALPKAATLPTRGDPRIAAGIAAAIRAQVTPCFTPPVGGAAAGKITALLHIAISRDGSIAGRPGLVSQTGVTGANAAYAQAFAEAAMRAVLRCAPLKLPAAQYDQWAQVEINFDPANF